MGEFIRAIHPWLQFFLPLAYVAFGKLFTKRQWVHHVVYIASALAWLSVISILNPLLPTQLGLNISIIIIIYGAYLGLEQWKSKVIRYLDWVLLFGLWIFCVTQLIFQGCVLVLLENRLIATDLAPQETVLFGSRIIPSIVLNILYIVISITIPYMLWRDRVSKLQT
jgi:ABC-type xylose transport system permease subunit